MSNLDTTPEVAFLLEDQAKKIAELTKGLEEYQRIFNMNYEADTLAIKLWQRRTGTTRTWPDRTDMVLFLMMELEKRTAEESSVVGLIDGTPAKHSPNVENTDGDWDILNDIETSLRAKTDGMKRLLESQSLSPDLK